MDYSLFFACAILERRCLVSTGSFDTFPRYYPPYLVDSTDTNRLDPLS